MGEYVLITGGAGFIGCNLADALLSDGERVVIADNLSRPGVEHNLRWLRRAYGGRVATHSVDVRDAAAIRRLVPTCRAVYHLAAQVAVTTSIEDPCEDLHTNLLGTFNVLEAARAARRPPPVLLASTNKVYGSLDHLAVERMPAGYRFRDREAGIDEAEPLDFHSPYGCSKGAADQYVRDYARIYGLPTVVFRMSCVYGRRQFGTEEQGWVTHFARAMLSDSPMTIYGDGFQVRDLVWVDDVVRAMRAAMDRARPLAGSVFNIGGGPANAVSVRGVLDRLSELTGREASVRYEDWRPGDQRIYISDIGRAREALDWAPDVGWRSGIERLVEWLGVAQLPPVPAGMFGTRHSGRLAVRPAV